MCGDGGELLICEGECNRAYHLECLGMETFPEADVWICPTCEAKERRTKQKVVYINTPEQDEHEGEEDQEDQEDTRDEDYGVKKADKRSSRVKGKQMGEMEGWVVKKTTHPDYPELKVLVRVKAVKGNAQKKSGGKREREKGRSGDGSSVKKEEEEDEEELSTSSSSPTHKGNSHTNSEQTDDENSNSPDNHVEKDTEGVDANPVKGKTSRRRSQSSRRSWANIYEESDTSVDEGDLQGEEEEEEFFDEIYSPTPTKCVPFHAYSSLKSKEEEEDGDYCQHSSRQEKKKQPGKGGSSKRSHASREPFICPVLGCDCVCDNRTSMMSHAYVL